MSIMDRPVVVGRWGQSRLFLGACRCLVKNEGNRQVSQKWKTLEQSQKRPHAIIIRGMHDDGSHNPKCLMGLRPGDWIFLWAVTAMPCSSIICVTLALWIQFVPQ